MIKIFDFKLLNCIKINKIKLNRGGGGGGGESVLLYLNLKLLKYTHDI